MCDLLWSSPELIDFWDISPRGAGYLFGRHIVDQFFYTNGIKMMIRSSEMVMEGYRWMFNKKLLTIHSAPNFAYRCGNLGAVALVDDNCDVEVITFNAVPDEMRINYGNKIVPEYFL